MAEHGEASSNRSALSGLIGAWASSLLVFFPIGIVLVMAMLFVGGSNQGAIAIGVLLIGLLALWVTNVWLWSSSRIAQAVALSGVLAAAMLISLSI